MNNKLHLFMVAIFVLLMGSELQHTFAWQQDSLANEADDSLKIIIGTFMGNEQRNYYGQKPPSALQVHWKYYLGKGITVISRKLGEREWAGAGWTGQPLLVEENQKLYLIQGAYDHHLKKIDVQNQELIWQYAFDDVIKGTGTLWLNPVPENKKDKVVIFQGSRLGLGNYLDSKHIPSYRAISYFEGSELWRLDVRWTDSYSRDVDGSALMIRDTLYIGLENFLLTLIDPDYRRAQMKDNMLQPKIFKETLLYTPEDVIKHKNNVVTESSPCLLGDRLYITSGAGHVYGYNLKTKEIDWDFYIGSDMDGSPVVTHDSCLLVSVEKQYICGNGGVFKLNPLKNPEDAVVWYPPTKNTSYYGWKGGAIGSVGINDLYNDGTKPYLAAFTSIDGYLYVVEHNCINKKERVQGPNKKNQYHSPKIIKKINTGPSISTPLIVDNKIIAAGYQGIHMYEYDKEGSIQKIGYHPGEYEATPVVWNGKIYVASRNGYLYCFGD